MKVSCILVSHNKPNYVAEAINSVLKQTHKDWELIVMDSGVLYDQNFFAQCNDERIKVYKTHETEEIRATKPMGPWSYNECHRRKLVSGDLVVYLCDDDIWYENAFEAFSDYASKNPDAKAMYGSQDMSIYKFGEEPMIYGCRKASEMLGFGYPGLDCRIDGGQFCHRLSLLDPERDYWPEDKKYETHADGVFMDRVCESCPCHPVPIKVGQNRRTPSSTYYPVPR